MRALWTRWVRVGVATYLASEPEFFRREATQCGRLALGHLQSPTKTVNQVGPPPLSGHTIFADSVPSARGFPVSVQYCSVQYCQIAFSQTSP